MKIFTWMRISTIRHTRFASCCTHQNQIPPRFELSRLIFRFVYLHCGITTSSSVSLFQESSTFFRKAKIKTTGKMIVETTLSSFGIYTWRCFFCFPWVDKKNQRQVFEVVFSTVNANQASSEKFLPQPFQNYFFQRTPYACFSLPVARTRVSTLTKVPFIFWFLRLVHRHKSRRTL